MNKTIRIFVLVFITAFPFVAGAQDFVPLTNLPGINDVVASESLPSFFNNLYKLCIGAAAVIAVLQIMRAGMYFMFNKGSVAHNEQGKSLITNSILGLLLVLSPAIVFSIINPDILDLRLNFEGIRPGTLEEKPVGGINQVSERVYRGSCSGQYNPIVRVTGATSCDAATGFEELPETCYAKTEGVLYCGKPIPSAQPDTDQVADNEYEWFLYIANATNGRISTSAGEWNSPGPRKRHATQQACQNDLSNFMTEFGKNHPTWKVEKVVCSCEEPRSSFAECKN